MKTLFLKIVPLLFYGLLPGWLWSQTIITTPGTQANCPGETIVPVLVTGCNGIGAISLKLAYNNAVFTYQGYQDVHPALSGGMLVVNSTGSKIIISWARTTAANVGNDTLIELVFIGVPGTSAMTWDTSIPGNCEYSDVNGNVLPATFTNGSATVYQNPVINTQPVDKTVLVGYNTSFTVSASAEELAHQWQFSIDDGNTWGNLSNVVPYSGVTTATLTITNAQLALDGNDYRCIISGECLPEVYTDTVSLTVINPVTTYLPTSGVCPGSITIPVTVTNFTGIAAFSLTFSYNTSFMTYTGYQSLNTALSGGEFQINASSDKIYLSWISTAAATIGDGTIVELLFGASSGSTALTWDTQTYGNCEYTDIEGDQVTAVYTNGNLTLYGLPTVVTQTSDRVIAKGQSTSFSITASGQGLIYQWLVSTDDGQNYSDLSNGSYYSNVTTATLNISGAQLALSGNLYRCRVTGTCPPVVFSNPAELIVLPNVITSCKSNAACPGEIAISITVTDFINVGAFSLALNFNQAILTFTGTTGLHEELGGGTFNANSSSGKVFLTWYNTSPATIPGGDTLVQILFNGIPGTSALTWNTSIPGNCEYSDNEGYTLYSTWNNGSATVYQPPLISTHPVNKIMYAGGSTTFSVAATGTGLGYQWQYSDDDGDNWTTLSNSSPYSGSFTATLTINPVNTALNGYQYRCYVTGTCTPYVYSDPATLTVTPAAITTTAGSVSNSCKCNLVIPVMVTNCNNITAISLTMNYDPAKLTFNGYQSLHAELETGMLVINPLSNQVKLSWISTDPAYIGNGMMIEFLFIAQPNISTSLSWDSQTPGNCEYTDMTGLVITSFYNSGSISVSNNALQVNAGNDEIIMVNGSAELNGTATGGTPAYIFSWEPETGLSNPNIANPLASPETTTIYTLTVTDYNGCSGFDLVTVTVTDVKTWTGAVNELWNVAGNWSPQGIPTFQENVYIPANAANMPEVMVNGMTCNNLNIDPDASITIRSGFSLDVKGDMTIGGP